MTTPKELTDWEIDRHVIGGSDLNLDNRGLDETWVTYNDNPAVRYEIEISTALDIVENAIENTHPDAIVGEVGEAIEILRAYLIAQANGGMYECPECNMPFNNRRDREAHVTGNHPD